MSPELRNSRTLSIGYAANFYARPAAPPSSTTELNLITFGLADLLNASYPRFMYLWSPGL